MIFQPVAMATNTITGAEHLVFSTAEIPEVYHSRIAAIKLSFHSEVLYRLQTQELSCTFMLGE